MSSVNSRRTDTKHDEPLDENTTYALLGNSRRRLILHAVHDADAPLTVRDLVEIIAAAEPDSDICDDRHCIRTSVKQRHLPRLIDVGAIRPADHAQGYVAGSEDACLVAIMDTVYEQLKIYG